MTDTLKQIITNIIDSNAHIRVEWGEDHYIDNTEDLADLILAAIKEQSNDR